MKFLKAITGLLSAALAAQTASAIDLPAQFNVGAQLDDTSTTAATENEFSFFRITPQRAEHVNLRNQAGTEIGTASTPIRTDPTGTTPQPSSQSGTWITGRTWSLLNSTDSVNSVQSGAWSTGRTWTLLNSTDSVNSVQSGAWTAGRTWTLGVATDSVVARAQDGSGNALTSQVNGSQRALDIGINVAGVQVDPRTRTWALASGTDSVQSVFTDIVPSSGTITAQDLATSTLVGANGQTFYVGTPTAGSAAVFTLASIQTVQVQASLLGSGGTMVIDVSQDGGTTWFRPTVFQTGTQAYGNGFASPFNATVNVANMNRIRVRGTTAWTGTATIIVSESLNGRSVAIGEALPPGGNVIGGVTQSGTFTVAQGTAAAASGAWPVKLTDGTSTTAVKAASTAPLATDPAAVVVLSPNGAQATAANQATEIASLSSIDTKTPALVSGHQPVQATLTTGAVFGRISVGTSAVELRIGASPLANRRNIFFTVLDAQDCYFGPGSGVTTANGLPAFRNQNFSIDADATSRYYVICSTISHNVALQESP